ncbi:MAG: RidA family protein [Gammaproteobacteria bacterium]|nr:RidA family protein [Gammaproteobacteria bacterium]
MNIKSKIALICIVATMLSACTTKPTIERKNYYTWENDYGYSQVVKAGNTLYISGIASNKPNFPGQITEIYTYINKILNDYGVDSDAIVRQVIYTTDIEGLQAQTSLRKSFFNENRYPSSSIVQIQRLYDKAHLLEIELVVVLPNE